MSLLVWFDYYSFFRGKWTSTEIELLQQAVKRFSEDLNKISDDLQRRGLYAPSVNSDRSVPWCTNFVSFFFYEIKNMCMPKKRLDRRVDTFVCFQSNVTTIDFIEQNLCLLRLFDKRFFLIVKMWLKNQRKPLCNYSSQSIVSCFLKRQLFDQSILFWLLLLNTLIIPHLNCWNSHWWRLIASTELSKKDGE